MGNSNLPDWLKPKEQLKAEQNNNTVINNTSNLPDWLKPKEQLAAEYAADEAKQQAAQSAFAKTLKPKPIAQPIPVKNNYIGGHDVTLQDEIMPKPIPKVKTPIDEMVNNTINPNINKPIEKGHPTLIGGGFNADINAQMNIPKDKNQVIKNADGSYIDSEGYYHDNGFWEKVRNSDAVNNNPITKTLGKIFNTVESNPVAHTVLEAARSAKTNGAYEGDGKGTGNVILDFISNAVGTGMGGYKNEVFSGLDTLVGQPVEKGILKAAKKTTVEDLNRLGQYFVSVARTIPQFSIYSMASTASNSVKYQDENGNIITKPATTSDVLNSGVKAIPEAVLWGIAGKALNDGFAHAQKVYKERKIGTTIMKYNVNTGKSNYVYTDNRAKPDELVNNGYIEFKKDIWVRNNGNPEDYDIVFLNGQGKDYIRPLSQKENTVNIPTKNIVTPNEVNPMPPKASTVNEDIQGNVIAPNEIKVPQNANTSVLKEGSTFTNKDGTKLTIGEYNNGQYTVSEDGNGKHSKMWLDDEELQQHLEENGYVGEKKLPSLTKAPEEKVIEDTTPNNGMAGLESDIPETNIDNVIAPKEEVKPENPYRAKYTNAYIDELANNDRVKEIIKANPDMSGAEIFSKYRKDIVYAMSDTAANASIEKDNSQLHAKTEEERQTILRNYYSHLTEEDYPKLIEEAKKKISEASKAPQEVKQPETSPKNGGTTKTEGVTLGRAGKAAFEKWGKNEYVNADLSNLNDPYTKAWTNFFNWWYDKGLNDEFPKYYERPNIGDEHFPPFLENRAFEAGQKDAKNKALNELTKGRDGKLPAPKTEKPKETSKEEIKQPEETKPTEIKKPEAPKNLKYPDIEFSITKTKHTKTGEDLWVVKINTKTDDMTFRKIAGSIKNIGGSQYSRFSKGFNFYKDPTEDIRKLGKLKGDEVAPQEVKQPEKTKLEDIQKPTDSKVGEYNIKDDDGNDVTFETTVPEALYENTKFANKSTETKQPEEPKEEQKNEVVQQQGQAEKNIINKKGSEDNGEKSSTVTENSAAGANERSGQNNASGVQEDSKGQNKNGLSKGLQENGEKRASGDSTGLSGASSSEVRHSDGTGNEDNTKSELHGASRRNSTATEHSKGKGNGDIKQSTIGTGNVKLTDDSVLYEGGKKTRYENNVAAIKLVKKLIAEERYATAAEQEILMKYVGWGGLSEVFSETSNYNWQTKKYEYKPKAKGWEKEYYELKELLTEDEHKAASGSTTNAHYTSPMIIKSMYNLIHHLGFKGGAILEPSMGIGHFFGFLPENMANKKTSLFGVELDQMTGQIAKQLYPEADIRISGFQNVVLPDNYFDVAIGNVPFGSYGVSDKSYKNKAITERIHNYFFIKSLDKVKAGGIVAFITSEGTLNSSETTIRNLIAAKADLVTAIRLPNNAFKENAGTEVTTDIIILRKRLPSETPNNPEKWMNVVSVDVKNQYGYTTEENCNEFFVNHPENVLGKAVVNKLYGRGYAVESDGRDIEKSIKEIIEKLPSNIMSIKKGTVEQITPEKQAEMLKEKKEGSYFNDNGKIFQKKNNELKEVTNNVDKIKSLIDVKDAVKDILAAQIKEENDNVIKKLQDKLNKVYEAHIKKHGHLRDIYDPFEEKAKQGSARTIKDDPEFYLLNALELVDEDKGTVNKADIFTKRVYKPKKRITSASTPQDALTISLDQVGYLNMEDVAKLYGKSVEETAKELKGLVYKNPEGSYETADEYLSGNVKNKLKIAISAAEFNKEYADNVRALEAVQPPDIPFTEIKLELGASWIPPQHYKQFLIDLLHVSRQTDKDSIDVLYNGYSGSWDIIKNNNLSGTVEAKNTYGTQRINAYDIINHALNLTKPIVKDVWYEDGIKKEKTNEAETEAALMKLENIKEEFERWVWLDKTRREELSKLYNEKFNNIRARKYDGENLSFVGLNPVIAEKVRSHQKNAIARIVYGGNTLLAHAVGAGKTWEMIIGAMELKRLGLRNKNLIVVPNNMLGQFQNDFNLLYPNAKVLFAEEDDFEPKNIKNLFASIATNDWDAIVIRHASLLKMPVSKETKAAYFNERISEVRNAMLEAAGDKNITKELETALKNLQKQLDDLDDIPTYDVATFEEMGIDQMFIDEAHEFKNLKTYTKLSRTKGVSTTNAEKSDDMYMKARYVSNIHDGKHGVVFATGTPISNSLTELYTMFRYLRPDLLKERNISHFDSWVSTFGRIVTDMEIDGTNNYKPTDRFKKFMNLPELIKLFKEFADVKMPEELKLPKPELESGKPLTIEVQPPPEYKQKIIELNQRKEALKGKGRPKKGEDNHLSINNEAKVATIDMRLLDPNIYEDYEGSKINRAVQEIYSVWKETTARKATQLIFLNNGVTWDTKFVNGKEKKVERFNLYKDLVNKLIALGIPKKEIALASDYPNKKRKTLYQKMNSGEIRVLIGTNASMGTGLNVQKKLFAIHELDVPYRPSDLEQGEGRMLRQGNEHKDLDIPVRLYRYVGNETFDAFMWQMIENKRRGINSLMKGDETLREMDDIEGEADIDATMKAIATGNPLNLERNKLLKEIKKLTAAQNSHMASKLEMQDKIAKLPDIIETQKGYIENFEKDKGKFDLNSLRGDNFKVTVDGEEYTNREDSGKKLLEIAQKFDESRKAANAANDKVAEHKLEEEPKVIGKAGNFNITLFYRNTGWNKYTDMYLENPETKGKYSIDWSGKTSIGIWTSVSNTLDRINGFIENYKVEVENNEKYLETAKVEVNKPFENEEKLNGVKSRLKEVNIALGIEKAPNTNISEEIQSDEENSDDVASDEAMSKLSLRKKPINGNRNVVKGKREILLELQKSLGVPFRVGRIRTLGLYKRKSEVIRTKTANDIEVAAHEAGHHLDKYFSIRKDKAITSSMKKELRELGKSQSKNSDKQFTEGIAEFVRILLTSEDETEARRNAPNFYSYFESKISSDNNIVKALDKFKSDFRNYMEASSHARVKASMSVGEHNKKEPMTFEKMYNNWLDDENPIKKYEDLITDGEKISYTDDAYIQARLFKGWQNKAIAYIKYGVYDENLKKVAPSLNEILKPVNKNLENFKTYALSRRVLELYDKRGIEAGIEIADAENEVNMFDSPEFRKAFDNLQVFNDAILDKLVDSGILSKAQKLKIKELNEDYVPLYRVFDENGSGKGTGRGFGNVNSPIRTVKGSNRTIIDPLESIVKNTFYFVNLAERNNVAKTLVELAEKYDGMGKFIEKVAPKMKPTSFQLEEITKKLEGFGVDVSKVDPEEVLTIFRPIMQASAKENIIAVYRNGKQGLYQLDPELYRAMLMLDTESSKTMMKILSTPTKLLRAGAILDPNFITRNPTRDMFSALVYSKYGFIPVVDTLRGLFDVIGQTENYKKFMASGAAGSSMVSMDRAYMQNILREVTEGKLKNVIHLFNPINDLRIVSEALENATRVSEFRKGLKKEGQTKEGVYKSAYAGREVTLDFERAGFTGRQANKLFPFFNATLQGTDKMIRAFKERPFRSTFLATLFVTLPSLILWVLFHDDEDIKGLPPYRKNLFWNIPVGNHKVLSIPKPFELGIIFGSLPERALDFAYDNNKEAMNEWLNSFKDGLTPNLIPTIFQIPFEYLANYNMFYGSNIDNQGDLKLPPEDRYNESTSGAAKMIGKLPTLFGLDGFSPKRIDNSIKGLTGGLGKLGLDITDLISGDKKGLNGIVGLKSFMVNSYTSNETINNFYNNLNKMEQINSKAVKEYKTKNNLTSSEYTSISSKKGFVLDTISSDDLSDLKKLRDINTALTELNQVGAMLYNLKENPKTHNPLTAEELNNASNKLQAAKIKIINDNLPERFKPAKPKALPKLLDKNTYIK